jgi:hypothetical protein
MSLTAMDIDKCLITRNSINTFLGRDSAPFL